MKKRKVTIVDYNAGNILSVSRAFEACGVEVELTNDQKKNYPSIIFSITGRWFF